MNIIKFDYNKLRGRIVEKYGNLDAFAKAMEISERSLSLKLNSHRYFTHDQIKKACELLDIRAGDIHENFFTLKNAGGIA